MADPNQKRDLVLPPGTYAFMQDVTKGIIKTYVGPYVITPTAQEIAVVYDATRKTFVPCGNLDAALQPSASAPEGSYIILENPAGSNKHPVEGTAQASSELDQGRTINIPGPVNFALWPGQKATVIPGHHLRSNQYALVRVYNEVEAKANWQNAVSVSTGGTPEEKAKAMEIATADLTMGKLLIIKGTDVSFYIPPTGIEVVAEMEGGMKRYVREALTLERLEYAVLVDEDGNKRFEKGPAVVFPEPTERFMESEGSKRFRAIDLNPIQGLHIKVIADYKDEDGTEHLAGEELFLTGKDVQIYYPRAEHSAVKYDGKVKTFATAIPAGEARYVLNRMTGDIRLVRGPHMLLPDPRTEVVVRRVLSDKQCSLWYPGNNEALMYNQGLRTVLANVPSTRSGAVSEGDYERGTKGVRKSAAFNSNALIAGANTNTSSFMETSRVSGDQPLVGEEFSRGSTYTAPRTVQLDTKYQGAPSLDIWTGYAVQVVSKSGQRRVVQGPTTVLLDYDETLEVLEMSTGRPKNTDNLLRTVYLRTENNKVSDVVTIETADHVNVALKLSYKVNFTGEPTQWFKVENYVKFLCDHARSILKGSIRLMKVEDFYANSTGVIRDVLLGKVVEGKRAGLAFSENGMRMDDVEVLGVQIMDENIQQLLARQQTAVVQSNIELSSLRRSLDVTKEKQSIASEEAAVIAATQKRKYELDVELATASLALNLTKISNRLAELEKEKETVTAQEEVKTIAFKVQLDRSRTESEQNLALRKTQQEQEIAKLVAESEAVVKRFSAATGSFSEALVVLGNSENAVKIAQAMNLANAIGGNSMAEALQKIFTGTPLAGIVAKMATVEAVQTAPRSGAAR